MIETDLYSSLKEVIDNVHPVKMMEGEIYPAIVYQVIYDGTSQSINGLICGRVVRIQVDIYAKQYGEAKSLKNQVVLKLLELEAVEISAQDLYEDDLKLHRQMIDFIIKE